jgi:small-conductance mechanosensitive channel
MKKFLLCFVLLAVLPVISLAQDVSLVFDSEAFSKTAQRAEEVVENGVASTEALEQLRAQLSKFRSAAQNQKSVSAQKVRPIAERLLALGEPPAEGETEAQDVANLRAELTRLIENRRAPVLAAEDHYQQADGLIKSIDGLIRERNTSALLKLEPSPLNPAKWWKAVTDLTSYSKAVKSEAMGVWENQNRKVARKGNIPVVAVLLGLSVLLLMRSRRWSRQVQTILMRKAGPRSGAIYGFIGSLAQLFFPFVGLMFLAVAADILDVVDVRGSFLIDAIVEGGLALYIASWLVRSLFIANEKQPALIELSPKDTDKMRRAFMMLGLVFALNSILDGIASGGRQWEDTVYTLTFPLICIGGWSLWIIGRSLSRISRRASVQESANPFMANIGVLMGKFCQLIGVGAPLLGAIGYAVASETLVISTATSLILIAAFYILFQMVNTLTGNISSVVVSSGSVEDQTRYGALFHIALGFAFICAAIPLLAMIWGVRFSEIQEIWLWLRDGVAIGDTRVSLTDFLTFVLIFSIGYALTRLLQSALRTTVLPNTRMDIGGQNAIVTGTGYVGIFFAAIAAITATGIDLSNLAIVAGALSVGIGFGLQTIVSNFVSGIILLIERPIKAGDWIEVGTYSGYVRKISVRSTEVETFDRASVVIPNADLIAGTVTNWTHSSMAGRVRVPVGVAYDSDPRHVEKVLRDVAEAHPMVLLDPAPAIMFMGFGADSMDFEIRAILRDVNWMLSAKSDMNFAISKAFREEGIDIPFAQRDVYIKNLDQLGAGKPADKPGEIAQDAPFDMRAPSVAAMDSSEDGGGEGDGR